ncbi:MAG: transglutaminase domain-containing protein [Lachnospiraceae bacterium]|nr:transglutaminase domain-containing protein [Lachnospiraceae bacterium]
MRERILRIRTQDIYRFVQAAFLTCILIMGAGESIGIRDIKAVVQVPIAFAVLAAVAGMQRMTKKGRVFVVLVLVIILGMTFGIRNCLLFIRSYAGWLVGADMWEHEWVAGYEIMQVIVAAVCCYILQWILEKYFLLKTAVLCMLVCALVYCLLTETPVSHAGVVCSLAYIMVTGGEWIEWCWDKEQKKDRKTYMFWLMPFMAVYILVMLWLPSPAKPFKWQFARNAFSQVKESFTVLTQNIVRGRSENFDTVLSGFPDDGRIRDNLEGDHRSVMVIQGEKNLAGNVYLAGRTYDAFDGRQWYRRDDNTEYEVFIDTIQTRYAAELFEGRYLRDCMSLTSLHVRYQYFNTAYVFVPLKTQRIMEGNKDLFFIPARGSLFFTDSRHRDTDQRGYGTEYDTVFYQLNAGSEVFEDFLVSMQNEDIREDAVMKSILQSRTDKTGIDITVEDVRSYIRQVNDVYAEDVILSDEARAYVDEITGSAHNDIEKLRMIEAELAAYTYAEDPGKLPDSVKDAGSFLDYFLLKNRTGYCTHFATAFALLARAEGLPSRYVQGFCVSVEQGSETVVYSDMAHAWPEVYINGVGWIPFEPTPGYGSLRYTSWETGWKYEPSFAMGGDYDTEYGVAADDVLAFSGGAEGIEEENALQGEDTVANYLKIAAYAVLTFASAGLLFIVFERSIRKKRYHKMNPEGRFDMVVRDNLRILAWLGLRRKDSETLQEFGRRAAVQLDLSKKEPAFIEKYEAIIYGGKSADEADVKEAGYEGKQLLGILKAKKKRTYFYYRVRVYLD